MKQPKKRKIDMYMPKKEYEMQKKLMSICLIETKQRMAYFFQNNFSFEGYEDWKKSQKSMDNGDK